MNISTGSSDSHENCYRKNWDKGTPAFLDDLTTYKRGIDRELYKLGIKDTNLRKPVVFPMRFHETEYASNHDEPKSDPLRNFSVRQTEAMQ